MYNTLSDFYTSKEWEKFRSILMFERLGADGTLYCEYCGKAITEKYDCIGHHKIELTIENVNDKSISLDPSNIMLVHHRCHNSIHERFGGQVAKKVFLVYGAPYSGKQEFVKSSAGHGDLILDINMIWEMVSGQPSYIKPERLKRNVFSIRDTMIDHIKTRYGAWRNAWVIMGAPLIMERQRLQQQLGCELVYIDTTKTRCYERLTQACERDNSINYKEYKWYIDDWFNKYQAEDEVCTVN